MSLAPEGIVAGIIALLAVLLSLQIRRLLEARFLKIKSGCEDLEKEYQKARQKTAGIKSENLLLEKNAAETITLFEITKNICETLETDKVFANFSREVNRYIEIEDCKFLKGNAELKGYQDYLVLPLEIDKEPVGFLAAKGVKAEDKDKFYILAQQSILGLKRALLFQRVQELAITDGLTGIFSRRYFLERLKEEIERSQKLNYSFSFLMIDVDYFKSCNDRYGHLVGDSILREVSQVIKENTRQIDSLGRYGGDEFALVLSETDKQKAGIVAERIRKSVESRGIRAYDEDLKVTVSIGIAVFPSDAKEVEHLIGKADQALYQAKQSGRNRVCVYL